MDPKPSKKVRLACRRCRTRRIKCDGGIPACSNCAKVGATCVDVDGQNAHVLIPRNFTYAARARIQWLENIIKENLPNIDLAEGPQVDLPSEPQGSSTPRDNDNSAPSATSGTAPREPSGNPATATRQHASSLKRTSKESELSDDDGSFPEQAHSVAMDLGMLSLNSDSSQKHYLGSSSGILFANLIGASPPSNGSAASPASHDPLLFLSDGLQCDTIQNPMQQTYLSLHQILRRELPKKEDALRMVQTYLRWVYPEYSVLEPSSLMSALDAIYKCSSLPLENDSLRHGWPSTLDRFRWNGRYVDPTCQDGYVVPMPVIAFILFMVFNIAAIIRVRERVYEFSPERFYSAALLFSQDTFSQISLPSIQALVMLVIHCLYTPAAANIWTLIHVAMAQCIEIGIHRDYPASPEDWDHQQMKRFIFFNIYSLDRCISSIQGRPLGLRDETFDVKMPEQPITPSGTTDTTNNLFTTEVLQYSNHQFRLDQIVSAIKTDLYHLPNAPLESSTLGNAGADQERIRGLLDAWWARASEDYLTTGNAGSRPKRIWGLKLKLRYHTAMLLLHQPSQAIRHPSEDSLVLCFNSACSILETYQILHDNQVLHHAWRTVQNIFAAGATLIYSFWTSKVVQRAGSTADMSRSLRICSSLLTIGGQWWPSARKGMSSFDRVVDLTVRKLYAKPSKQPRLAARTETNISTMHTNERVPQDVTDSTQENGRNSQSYSFHEGDGLDLAQHGISRSNWSQVPDVTVDSSMMPMPTEWYVDQTTPEMVVPEFFPEIEGFLADFDRSEFSWNLPLNTQETESLTFAPEIG